VISEIKLAKYKRKRAFSVSVSCKERIIEDGFCLFIFKDIPDTLLEGAHVSAQTGGKRKYVADVRQRGRQETMLVQKIACVGQDHPS
jgi:hypothetical protein